MGFPVDVQRYVPLKKYITKFPDISANQAPPQTVAVPITAAWNFLDMYLKLTNVTSAMINELRLKIGGNVIQRWLGTDLDNKLQYDKQPLSTTYGYLKVPLRRMGLRSGMDVINFDSKTFFSGQARELAYESSLNCGSAGGGYSAITDVSLELDLINTGAAPSVSVYARVTPPIPGGPGSVLRIDKQSKNIANGTVVITKAEMGIDALRSFINRIYLIPAAGTLDTWALRYGTNDWWQIDSNLLNYSQVEDGLRTLQGGMYVLDFQEEGWGDTMLDMSAPNSDILLQFVATGAAGNLTYYVESLGVPFSANPK